MQKDVGILCDGSVSLVTPLTPAAMEWVEGNVVLESWQWVGAGFGVEWRFVGDLARGMRDAGLVVTGGIGPLDGASRG